MEIKIEDMKRLDVMPGDIVVVKLDRAYPQSAIADISRRISDAIPDHIKIMIIGPNVEISIIRPH